MPMSDPYRPDGSTAIHGFLMAKCCLVGPIPSDSLDRSPGGGLTCGRLGVLFTGKRLPCPAPRRTVFHLLDLAAPPSWMRTSSNSCVRPPVIRGSHRGRRTFLLAWQPGSHQTVQ